MMVDEKVTQDAPEPSGLFIDGPTLQIMLSTARIWLELNALALNSINVYPVPDGDTGSNLSDTLIAATNEIGNIAPSASVSEVASTAARGALLGARGNSGVIFSQWLGGIAHALDGIQKANTEQLANAFIEGENSAYQSIGVPKEGTILSIARTIAHTKPTSNSIIKFLESSSKAANEAVEKTKNQMPLLAEAGVVDAGGQGLAIILEGLLIGLKKEVVPSIAKDIGEIDSRWLSGNRSDLEHYQYCTEFIIDPVGNIAIDSETVRRKLNGFGDSLIVAGIQNNNSEERNSAGFLHVHIHTNDPDGVYIAGEKFGSLSKKKSDDIQKQHENLLSQYNENNAYAIVAMTSGRGFMRILKDLGVESVILMDGSNHPKPEEILEAAKNTHAPEVIVLPNNPNTISASIKAANSSSSPRIHIIHTENEPEAVTALSAVPKDASVAEICKRMDAARAEILTGFITRMENPVESPIHLKKNQPIALLNGEIVATETSEIATLVALAIKMQLIRPDAELLTVYCEKATEENETQLTFESLKEALPRWIEVELVIGEQENYPFIASLE